MTPPLDKKKLPKTAAQALIETCDYFGRLRVAMPPAEWRTFLTSLDEEVRKLRAEAAVV